MTRFMPASYLNTMWKSKISELTVEVTGLWNGYSDNEVRFEIFSPQIKTMIITERILTKVQLEEKFIGV